MIIDWNNEIPKDDRPKLLKLSKFIGQSRYKYKNRYLIGHWDSTIECWVDCRGEEVNDVEGWAELEEKPITTVPTMYICDRKAECCKSLMCGKECKHTTDVTHAANFERVVSSDGKYDQYWEAETMDDDTILKDADRMKWGYEFHG